MRRTLHLHSEGWRDGREQRRSSSIGTGQQKSEQEAEETKRRQPVRHYFPLIFKQNFFFFLVNFIFFLLVFLFPLSLAVSAFKEYFDVSFPIFSSVFGLSSERDEK